MQLLNLTLPTIAENLALDEALLLRAEAGGPEILRLWEFPTLAVVLGSGGKLLEDVDEAACRADGIPIARRSSGGGTVLLGQGCLLYTLVLRYQRDPALREIASSYGYILDRVRAALAGLLPEITMEGTSDLASGGLKFSGNAQQRKRDHLLHHGTLLYGFDLERIPRYLRIPVRQPEYREGRRHECFVRNLPATGGEVRERIRRAWDATDETCDWPGEPVNELATMKYSDLAWIARR